MLREPVVAGYFYSDQPEELHDKITAYFQASQPSLKPKAVICPHAGYIYSGAVAGAVFGMLDVPEHVIIMGPNHTGRGAELSIYPEGNWRTPLGSVSIDKEMTDRLIEECPLLCPDRLAHLEEHSVEVQIPFLQARAPAFRFSAICVGISRFSKLEELGHALARVARSMPEPPLLVVSSDMNHYESAQVAYHKDHEAIQQVLEVNPEGLHRTVIEKEISMCGFAPAVAALVACRDLGASKGILIRYSNSGDVSGDHHSVVGYAGMAVL